MTEAGQIDLTGIYRFVDRSGKEMSGLLHRVIAFPLKEAKAPAVNHLQKFVKEELRSGAQKFCFEKVILSECSMIPGYRIKLQLKPWYLNSDRILALSRPRKMKKAFWPAR